MPRVKQICNQPPGVSPRFRTCEHPVPDHPDANALRLMALWLMALWLMALWLMALWLIKLVAVKRRVDELGLEVPDEQVA